MRFNHARPVILAAGLLLLATLQTFADEPPVQCLGDVIPASAYGSVAEGPGDIDLSSVDKYGRFVGELLWRALPDGRRMQLTTDYSYIDPTGRRWLAREGSCVDGASIPRVFWSVIGGPFEGRYRNASVLHDVACRLKDQPWERVHRMFYYGMRTAGVSNARALLLYAAVQHFGPRWQHRTNILFRIGDGIVFLFRSLVGRGQPPPPPPPYQPTPEDVRKLEELLRSNNVTRPEQVDDLDVPNSKRGSQYE